MMEDTSLSEIQVAVIRGPGLRIVEVYVELVSMWMVGFRNSRGQTIAFNHIHVAIKPA